MTGQTQLPRRHGRRMLLIAIASAMGLAICGCIRIPPRSFKQVKSPRGGRALGRRVAVVYSKHYQINVGGLEKLHSFDIHKYAKIYLALVTDGVLAPTDVFVPEAVTREQLLRVHTPAYLATLKDPRAVARYLEIPVVRVAPASLVDAAVLNAFRYATGGTILAARLALDHGVAINLAGGYHHAKPDTGEGFCIYADMPIAIKTLQGEGRIKRALVVDLDVHQGNGTAECFAGDDSVFTFSMHQGDIYPIPKATSDVDVNLPAGTGDSEYLRTLQTYLPRVLERARPDIVFLQAGCDTLDGDPLAQMRMTIEGITRRDAEVIDACTARGTPVVMVLGGGYSRYAWYAQYLSVRRTIEKHGLPAGRLHPRRRASRREYYPEPPHHPQHPAARLRRELAGTLRGARRGLLD
ncbi:hypothetical protein LCGC14_2397690, partial [marine sediment metagenome]